MRDWLQTEERNRRIVRFCMGALCFFLLAAGVFFVMWQRESAPNAYWAQVVYMVGSAGLLAGLGTGVYAAFLHPEEKPLPRWFCPLAAGGLTLILMLLAYAWLEVWPLGGKSVMMVDMHHQYAPLLSELRSRLLSGDFSTYSFHIGLGASYLPAFAYYLASPLNLLLVLFPERLLCEGVWVITLLKFALAATSFAACAQYLYRRRNGKIVAVAALYAVSGYMLAYSWNIMWLDGMVLLPAVVLGLEYMLREGKFLPYTLLLALALYANYYIGFMLCLFLVLYFLVWLVRQPRTGHVAGGAFGRFAGASLLAGGLAAFLLVPTALALSHTSAAGGSMPEFEAKFSLFDLFGRLFYGASPTIRSGNLPNLYCGVAAVLLLPVYLSDRRVSSRRRLAEGGLLAVLALSCTINQWDLLWHGLHTPNDLPYRFSFLLCFVLLLMAGRALCRMEEIQPKAVLWSLMGCATYLVLWEKLDEESFTAQRLYVNLLLLVLYAAGILFTAWGKLPVRVGRMLLVLVVSAELLLGAGDTLRAMDQSEYFTQHDAYVDNAATEADEAALRRAEALAEAEGQVFCRMEFLPRRTCMDTALYHYNGITTFSSSNPFGVTAFMGELGYAINGVNSYMYQSYVAAPDALVGIRYLVLEVRLADHDQLELVDSVTVEDETRYIYRNRLALPVGYAASAAALDYSGTMYAPFTCQQDLYSALMGEEVSLYTSLELTADGGSVTGDAFSQGAKEQGLYKAMVDTEGQYFAYVDCSAAESIQVSTYTAEGEVQNIFSVTPYEPYIIDLGVLLPGQIVETQVDGKDGSLTGHVYVERLDGDVLNRCIEKLNDGGFQVEEASATRLSGTVTAANDGVVVFSIPYDSGWQITVDGEKAQTTCVGRKNDGGALLAVSVGAGAHQIELQYTAPGLVPGILISAASLVLLVLWVLYTRRRSKLPPVLPGAEVKPDEPETAPGGVEEAPETATGDGLREIPSSGEE